jgi:hypothetical protein
MKYQIAVTLLIILKTTVFSAFEQNEAGARAYAMGGAFVASADNCWSIFYNPGGLIRMSHNEFSLFYLPRQFGLKELSTSVVAGNIRSNVGSIGFGLRRFGFNLYKEITGCVTYSNEISDVGVGITVNYYSLTISGYGSDAAIGLDVGILFPVLNNLNLGVVVKNINMATIGKAKEPIPQIYSTGLSYSPLENMTITVDYRKEISYEGSVRTGMEYKVFDMAYLRIGAANVPSTYSAGIGFEYEFFKFDYSFYTHQELGITHTFSLTIIWGGEDE